MLKVKDSRFVADRFRTESRRLYLVSIENKRVLMGRNGFITAPGPSSRGEESPSALESALDHLPSLPAFGRCEFFVVASPFALSLCGTHRSSQ